MEKDFFRAGEFYSLRIMVWPVSIYLVEDGPTKSKNCSAYVSKCSREKEEMRQ